MGGVMNPGQRDTSLLTTVMKGLSIARDIYGIKADMSKLEAAEANEAAVKAERERLASGRLNQGEVQAHKFAGATEVPKGTPGGVTVQTEGGQALTLLPKQATPKEGGGSWQTVAGPNGSPLKKWIADRGGDFKPYIEPKENKSPGQTTDLRKEYNSDHNTKRTYDMLGAPKAVTSAAQAPIPSPATDMSLLYSYIKMLDPGSAVKEGEYAAAEDTRGINDKLVGLYNKARLGVKLDDTQRAAFAAEANRLMDGQLESQKDTDDRYAGLAKDYGLKPQQVLDPRFSIALQKKANPAVSAAPSAAPSAPAKAGPGALVESGGKKYRVGADGDTLTPVTGTAGP